MSTTTPQSASGLSAAQGIWLVAEREIGSKLRSKAFVISTAILFVGALALVIWGGFAVFDVDSDETAQRVLRRAVDQGDVASFAPQHPTLAQIFKEVIQ